MAEKSKPSLQDLKKYFNSKDIPNEPFYLTPAVYINDVNKTIESMISMLEANPGNRAMMPYYNTLYLIYKHLRKNE